MHVLERHLDVIFAVLERIRDRPAFDDPRVIVAPRCLRHSQRTENALLAELGNVNTVGESFTVYKLGADLDVSLPRREP